MADVYRKCFADAIYAMVRASKSCSLDFPMGTFTGAVEKRVIGLVVLLHTPMSHLLP